MKKSFKLSGQSAILLCAVLWSTSGLFIKLITWHPFVISGVRSFLAVLFLLAVRMRQENQKNIFKHFTSGIWYAATMILFVFANKLTFAANAILLQYTAPVWACFLGWLLLKEKPHWEHWIALTLVGLGMFLVFGNGLSGNSAESGAGSFFGNLLALISGFTFAASSVVLRKHKEENPLDIMINAHIICFAVSLPFFFIYPPQLNAPNILSVLFMGIFQIGTASALFAYGLKRVRVVQAMLTAAIEPVLNPIWVLLVLGEIPSFLVIAGGVIIIAAVIFSSLFSRKREISKSA